MLINYNDTEFELMFEPGEFSLKEYYKASIDLNIKFNLDNP